MADNYDIEIYKTPEGKEPYIEWEHSLDYAILAKIDARFTRMRESGHLGDYKPVGEGVYEGAKKKR